MEKFLGKVLLGAALAFTSPGVWAQCASGGSVGTGGYCYYSDGSCPTHQPYSIPGYCQKSENRPVVPPLPPRSDYNEFDYAKPNITLPVVPNQLDGYGALAEDSATGEAWLGFDWASDKASAAALKNCGAATCRILLTYKNSCVAVSAPPRVPKVRPNNFYATGPDKGQAKQAAFSKCSAKYKNCRTNTDCWALPIVRKK